MNSKVTNPFRKAREIANKLSEHLQRVETGTTAKELLLVGGVPKNSVITVIEGAQNPLFEISESWGSAVHIQTHVVDQNGDKIEYMTYENLKANRMNFILYRIFAHATHRALSQAGIEFGYNSTRTILTVADNEILIRALGIIGTAEHNTTDIATAIEEYNASVETMFGRLNQEERAKASEKTNTGISALVRKASEVTLDKDAIEAQITEASAKLQNGLVARTWGWEVEAPNPGEFRTPAGVEAGSDGSVESFEANDEDCECGCRDCTYHDCNCDNCDYYNDAPDHCRDGDCNTDRSYEFRTVGGVTRILHPGLKNLLDQIGNTEKNETAGTHIHVYARDLDAFQIGVVLGGYALTQKVWDVLAGRDVNNDARCKTYANIIPAERVSYALRNKKLSHVGKFNAINTLHVGTDRGTLEFRQMDCNFNFDRISLMAFMARGLVEVAKRGAKLNDFINITDLNGLIKVYAKYGFTYESETDEIDNPHGSRYNQSRTAPVIA